MAKYVSSFSTILSRNKSFVNDVSKFKVKICAKSRRIGCVIPHCNLSSDFFLTHCGLIFLTGKTVEPISGVFCTEQRRSLPLTSSNVSGNHHDWYNKIRYTTFRASSESLNREIIYICTVQSPSEEIYKGSENGRLPYISVRFIQDGRNIQPSNFRNLEKTLLMDSLTLIH